MLPWFDLDGYSNQFSKEKWKLTKDSLTLAEGRKVNILYVIEVKIKKENQVPDL